MDDDAYDSTVLVGKKFGELKGFSVIVVVDDTVTAHQLPRAGEVMIGRFTGSRMTINHDTISRFHATVRITSAGITIEDLGSANGTFVREVRISPGKQIPVSTGDVVRLGEAILIFRWTDPR